MWKIKTFTVLSLITSPSDVGFVKTHKWVHDGFMCEQNKKGKIWHCIVSLGNGQRCRCCFVMTRDQMWSESLLQWTGHHLSWPTRPRWLRGSPPRFFGSWRFNKPKKKIKSSTRASLLLCEAVAPRPQPKQPKAYCTNDHMGYLQHHISWRSVVIVTTTPAQFQQNCLDIVQDCDDNKTCHK